MDAIFKPSRLVGVVKAPQSKSIAIRLLFSSLLGKVVLKDLERSDDVEATLRVVEALGVSINGDKYIGRDLPEDAGELFLGGSGTALRMLIPILACAGINASLTGDETLQKRPLDVLYKYLNSNGVTMSSNRLPLKLGGKLDASPIEISGSESSQYISGFIFGLLLKGGGKIVLLPPVRSSSYIEMTCKILNDLGAEIIFSENEIIVNPLQKELSYTGFVPGDFLLSSFYAVGAALTKGNVEIRNLVRPEWSAGDSRIFDIVKGSSNSGTYENGIWSIAGQEGFKPFTEDVEDSPDMAVSLASLAFGSTEESEISGIELLKIKESDRITSITETLASYGSSVETNGTMRITGPETATPGTTEDWHDHRIAMLGSILSLRSGGTVKSAEAVSKSNPRFFEDIRKLGGDFQLK